MNYPVINKPIRQQMIDFHRRELERWKDIVANCTDCENFIRKDKTCFKYNAVIPDEVVGVGCDEWTYDIVPF